MKAAKRNAIGRIEGESRGVQHNRTTVLLNMSTLDMHSQLFNNL